MTEACCTCPGLWAKITADNIDVSHPSRPLKGLNNVELLNFVKTSPPKENTNWAEDHIHFWHIDNNQELLVL